MQQIECACALLQTRIMLQQGHGYRKRVHNIANKYITLFFILCYLGLSWLCKRLYEILCAVFSGCLLLFSFVKMILLCFWVGNNFYEFTDIYSQGSRYFF